MKTISTCLVLLFALCRIGLAASETVYVDPACPNAITAYVPATHACTGGSSKSFSTITNAWAGISGTGNTINVRAGTYVEQLFHNFEGFAWKNGGVGAYNVMQTYNSEAVTIRPASGATKYRVMDFINNRYIEIEGFIIDGANIQYDAVKIEQDNSANQSDHIRFRNCEVINGRPVNNGFLVGGAGHEFIGLNVHNNGGFDSGTGTYRGYGFYMGNTNANIIEDCLIHDNASAGISQYNAIAPYPTNNIYRRNRVYGHITGSGVGIGMSTGSGNSSYNNVIYNNRYGNTADISESGAKILNNTVWNHSVYGISLGSVSNVQVKNNISYQSNGINVSGGATGTVQETNFTTDPMFVNAAAADFRLVAASQAIGAAASCQAAYYTTDIVGTSRPQGLACDVGAYEFIDLTAPVISISGPANGATVVGNVAVSASVSDNVGVSGVQFKLDGNNLGAEDTSAPYGVNWDSTASSNAVHVLTAVARDAANNTATSPAISVTVNNPGSIDMAPTVSITSPLNGATVSGTITVAATATDDVSVSGVQFKLDGVNLGSEDTSAPYGVSWATPSSGDGVHQLLAVARDPAGHSTTSTVVNVTVNNPPPTISAIAAGSITSSAATITWTTSTAANSQVEYGTTTAYGSSTVLNASLVTSHSQGLTGLAAFTLYHYRVKSADVNNQLTVSGDNTFTTLASGATTLTITSPAGGETWVKDSVHTITWDKSADVTGNIRVLVSRNGGSTFRTIVNSVAASAGTVNWTVTPPSCNNCLIRVNSLVNPAVFDNSATFQIVVH